MDFLPHSPRNFYELVEADLRRAARLIIKVQDEIDWQVRMATPEGDYLIAVTMPNAPDARRLMMRRIETLLQWKRCTAFCLAVEIYTPDAIYAVGVARDAQVNCMSQITRHPKPWTSQNFGPVEWLPDNAIDPSIAGLLPRQPEPMTPAEISSLQKWFGVNGQFPAVHIPTGEVRGL